MSAITYIDGSNLLCELAKQVGVTARADKPTDSHLALACLIVKRNHPYADDPLRRYWFASYQGTDTDCLRIKSILRKNGFEAVLFKKNEGREKGVDISLTREMLVHAFHRNCRESILIAGDEDYVPLVNEVKRYGQRVRGQFFARAMSIELAHSLDDYAELNDMTGLRDGRVLLEQWENELGGK